MDSPRVRALTLMVLSTLSLHLSGQSVPKKTVVLSPMYLPELLDSLPRAAVVESLLTTELTAAGYTVVPSHDAGVIWKRLVDSVQGVFDPINGGLDSVKYRAVHGGTRRELNARFGPALWLRDSVDVSVVDWAHNAEWDGQKEAVGDYGAAGKVPVLTLILSIEDSDGNVVASGRGGLQVLYKADGVSFRPVPRQELFADVKRMRRGVRAALQTFLPGEDR